MRSKILVAATLHLSMQAHAQDPSFQLYLLFGQSNMEGMAAPEAQDRTTNPRIKVLGYTNCTNLGREYDKWYLAAPPLHGCNAGVGPGDYFSKAMADSFPKATIGLIPGAIAGVDIDYFRKGIVSRRRNEFTIPPDNKRPGAYDMLIEKAREAQRAGVIRGILFHQGESDAGDTAWIGKVKGIVSDLRKDLALGDSVPFLAGELLYGGCCDKHNPIIARLPAAIPNAWVISAKGLPGQDQAHFNVIGQRELGRRYAARMAPLVRSRIATSTGRFREPPPVPGLVVRLGPAGTGLEIRCEAACSAIELIDRQGRRLARAEGQALSLPSSRLSRGIYWARSWDIAGKPGHPATVALGQ
jgi:hypothetical protein